MISIKIILFKLEDSFTLIDTISIYYYFELNTTETMKKNITWPQKWLKYFLVFLGEKDRSLKQFPHSQDYFIQK